MVTTRPALGKYISSLAEHLFTSSPLYFKDHINFVPGYGTWLSFAITNMEVTYVYSILLSRKSNYMVTTRPTLGKYISALVQHLLSIVFHR